MKIMYENICFEGGGIKGFAYIGAIIALEEKGLTNHLTRFSGSSVGSLFASLLCVGFTGKEINNIIGKLSLSLPYKSSWSKIYSLWNSFGIHEPTNIEKDFREIIKMKVNPDITLEELYKITNNDLVIVATNFTKRSPEYFHHKTHPNIKLVDAFMASISIPIFFQPRKITYESEDYYYVDGGIIDNYPIWVFNDIDKLMSGNITKIDKNSKVHTATIGLSLYEHSKITSIINMLLRKPTYIDQTIYIQVPSISFVNFSLNDTQKNDMIKIGRDTVSIAKIN